MNAKQTFIYRAKRDDENPYFQHRRATAQDRALTFEARGMLSYLLSQSDTWKVQPADLEQQCKKSVVYRILGELIRHGYIDRQQERDEKKKIIAWHYIVHEEPLVKNLLPKKQEVALPEVEKLEIENQDIRDKRVLENKENTSVPLGTGAQPNPETIPVVIDVIAQANKVIEAVPEKTRTPDLVFDAVALHIFEIDPLTVTKESGGRIGPIAQWLKGKSEGLKRAGGKVGFISRAAEPEHVKQFALWYKGEYPDANLPYDLVKFVESWRKWATVMSKRVIAAPKAAALSAPRELTQAERDELAAARQSIRPTWEKVGVQ